MKSFGLLATVAFLVAFFVRFIEMSVQFDWIDIVWTVLFLIGVVISADIYKKAQEW